MDAAGTARRRAPRRVARDLFDLRRWPTTVRIATCRSEPALWKARHAASLKGGDVSLVVVDTVAASGASTAPIWEMGGKACSSRSIQAAVLDGRADLMPYLGKDSVDCLGRRLARSPQLPRGCSGRPVGFDAGRAAAWRRPPPDRRGGGPSWPTCGST